MFTSSLFLIAGALVVTIVSMSAYRPLKSDPFYRVHL